MKMRFLIILIFITNLFAKDKSIFLDAEVTIPFSGIAYSSKIPTNDRIANSPTLFMGVSVGYSFNMVENYFLEPSIGYHFSATDIFYETDNGFNYNYYDFTLPIMYHKKGFKGGIFMRYMKIPSFEVSNFYNERTELLKNKDAYSIGVKAVTSSWFVSYEYLFDGKYSSVDKTTTVDIEGSRISIGLRNTF